MLRAAGAVESEIRQFEQLQLNKVKHRIAVLFFYVNNLHSS